jgi:hypothetical protein
MLRNATQGGVRAVKAPPASQKQDATLVRGRTYIHRFQSGKSIQFMRNVAITVTREEAAELATLTTEVRDAEGEPMRKNFFRITKVGVPAVVLRRPVEAQDTGAPDVETSDDDIIEDSAFPGRTSRRAHRRSRVGVAA